MKTETNPNVFSTHSLFSNHSRFSLKIWPWNVVQMHRNGLIDRGDEEICDTQFLFPILALRSQICDPFDNRESFSLGIS